jgi:RNA polymerase sigma factor (sigma-70 family)
MVNPFRDSSPETKDETLVEEARAGSRDSLERLLARHQPWIYNLSLRMLCNHQDAEDATQDVLIKVLKGLATFRAESAFRTWLYRIAVNHLLNVKKERWNAGEPICSFDAAAGGLRQTPDLDLPDPKTLPVPIAILVEEAKISCSLGTLLCLDGRQRLAFVLAELFGVSDEVGGQILDVTPVNFRQILSRARRDLYEYLRGNCSLVNPDAVCTCARKTQAFVKGGFVDPERLTFTSGYRRRVREVADERMNELLEAYARVGADVYRGHPFYERDEQVVRLREALKSVSLEPPR